MPGIRGDGSNVDAYARDTFNAISFGASTDGVTDVRAAVLDALAAVTSYAYSATGSLNSYSKGVLHFPPGKYKFSDSVDLPAGFTVTGDRAILVGSAGKDIFRLTQTGLLEIRGITFRGGRYGISVENGGVSDCVYMVGACEFMDQTGAAIRTDNNSSSTNVYVRGCHFYMGTSGVIGGGNIGKFGTGDKIVVRDCWLGAAAGNDAFVIGHDVGEDGAVLVVDDCGGGPIGTGDAFSWFKLISGQLNVQRSRFGGEASKCILRCYDAGAEVIIRDCAAYSTGLNNYEFYAIPTLTEIFDNTGNGNGIYFDSSIPAADLRNLGNGYSFRTDMFDGLPGINELKPPIVCESNGGFVAAAAHSRAFGVEHIPATVASFVRRLIPGDSGYAAGESVNTTIGTATGDFFGFDVNSVVATSSGGKATLQQSDTVRGLPNGTYTAVFNVKVTDGPCMVICRAAGAYRTGMLTVGTHVLSVPFELGAFTTDWTVGQGVSNVANAAHAYLADVRIFAGRVDQHTPNVVVYGAAAPSANGRWRVGDRVVSTAAPSAGGTEGWICTVAGLYEAAWQATTAYVIGNQVTNDTGKVYRCITAGTSAGSGGPTGTGADITDGTVHWKYLGAAPTFKAYGVIAA